MAQPPMDSAPQTINTYTLISNHGNAASSRAHTQGQTSWPACCPRTTFVSNYRLLELSLMVRKSMLLFRPRSGSRQSLIIMRIRRAGDLLGGVGFSPDSDNSRATGRRPRSCYPPVGTNGRTIGENLLFVDRSAKTATKTSAD